MKFKLIFIFLLFGQSYAETFDDLVFRNGLYYKKFTDIPFTGEITGQAQGNYKNGLKHGDWVIYYSDGQLQSKGKYIDGHREGIWERYDEHGTIHEFGKYIKGKKNGNWFLRYENPHMNVFKDGFNLTQKEIREKKKREQEKKKREQEEQEMQRLLDKEDALYRQKNDYINQIARTIKANWVYQGAKDDWGCDVYILQDESGNIQSVNIQSCKVGNKSKMKSFRNSIERAVYKSTPLPVAPSSKVFEKELMFFFRVN